MSDKKLMSLDDMFGDSENISTSNSGITEMEITNLVPFSNHPFKLYEGERLKDMIDSIKEFGVIVPIVVRSIENEKYQILSGHNRVNAAKIAGITKVPVAIKEGLTEDEATLIVTETNLIQRSFGDLLHSERTAAIAQRYKTMKQQGKRRDLLEEIEMLANPHNIKDEDTSSQLETKLRTDDKIAQNYNLSRNMVARYVRLSELNSSLMKRLDDNEIAFMAAVTLSFLKNEEQEIIESVLIENSFKLDMKKAETLRNYSTNKKLNKETAYSILSGELNRKTKSNKPAIIKLKPKLINKYFSPEVKQPEIEDIIDKALKLYFNFQGEEVED